MHTLDRYRVKQLLVREREGFADAHPRSAATYAGARPHLLGGVPMTWMNKAAGGFPLYLDRARGARVTDIDGHEYVDFALGDTGAMAGHSPKPLIAAVRAHLELDGGIAAMMPTENAAWVGQELGRRFGLPLWSFTLTATDANRWAIRLARQVTGRPKILVNAWCYHGSVDEAFAVGVQDAIDRSGVPWSAVQLGARVEYRFASPAPRSGSGSAAAADPDLDDFLHTYLANRGVLLTPFHNMALMSPETTDEDVDRHTELFAAAVGELVAA